jgi:hypothetical protein
MKKRIEAEKLLKRMFCIALLTYVFFGASGCSVISSINPFGKKDEVNPAANFSVSGVRRVSGVRPATPAGAPSLALTSTKEYNPANATGTAGAGNVDEKQKASDLIKESGFDMIYPNFNKETGRQDPFVPVSLSSGPLDVIRQMTPEKFRVIGTAMTPTGQIAMIEVGEQTKIVREGDVLESGHVVKTITKYDVVLEKDARQVRLTMFTRTRIAQAPTDETNYPKLPGLNINDMYIQYLKDKYGEDVEGKEGETKRPKSFNDFLGKDEKNMADQVLEGTQ